MRCVGSSRRSRSHALPDSVAYFAPSPERSSPSRLADRSPRALLIHTIDPNRVVERQYIEYTILTEHGLFISGFLFDETEDCIRLADGQGELKRVRRGDIDEWESTYRSQMPEGLEGNRTLQEMADLITFIVGALPSDECQLGPTN